MAVLESIAVVYTGYVVGCALLKNFCQTSRHAIRAGKHLANGRIWGATGEVATALILPASDVAVEGACLVLEGASAIGTPILDREVSAHEIRQGIEDRINKRLAKATGCNRLITIQDGPGDTIARVGPPLVDKLATLMSPSPAKEVVAIERVTETVAVERVNSQAG